LLLFAAAMRLLSFDDSRKLVLRTFESSDLPAYAILSHTWDTDNSREVDFQDLEAGRGEAKEGYKKIAFCAKQVARDGLQYFWVDTCCINRSSDAELSESINRMFQWYKQATRCYVYLSDVDSASGDWEAAVRRSRWFTRGWTLQELIAPQRVLFYARDGGQLGDKLSLERLICEVTGVAKDAINGDKLTSFSFKEKMSWVEKRSTKKEEDIIYSMLGIFNVSMPVIYGEGSSKALRRLRREVDDMSTSKGAQRHRARCGPLTRSAVEANRLSTIDDALTRDGGQYISSDEVLGINS
jgi:hypothetical protein